jgi:8-oxo-dGTP pyrophosphatase MutT (NUDIX family)
LGYGIFIDERCQDLQGNLVQPNIKHPQILALILPKLPSLVIYWEQKDARSRLMKKRTSDRRKPKSGRQVQYAALPYRAKGKSQLEIMLVTSRGTRRWIIPKGWPKRGMPPYDTAAKEAFEEAGVIGKVSKRPIGSYPYEKILQKGDKASCRVQVFALRVTRQHKRWPEKRERQVRWYPPAEAARFVRDPHLRRIIRKFAKRR